MRSRGKGAKSFDAQALRAVVTRMIPMTTALGVVRKFPGEDSHFEIQIDDDGKREIMVDVELMPRSEKLFCRLGFGQDQIYKIPRVGQEVAVLIPFTRDSLVKDELDSDGFIVAILDTDVPADLDGDDIIVINSPRVKVIADTVIIESADIRLGGENPSPIDQIVVGSGIDSFTGLTYFALGATTAKVKAEK